MHAIVDGKVRKLRASFESCQVPFTVGRPLPHVCKRKTAPISHPGRVSFFTIGVIYQGSDEAAVVLVDCFFKQQRLEPHEELAECMRVHIVVYGCFFESEDF